MDISNLSSAGSKGMWVNNVVLPVHPCLGANISVTAHVKLSQKLSATLLKPWVAVEKVDNYSVMMTRLRGTRKHASILKLLPQVSTMVASNLE